VSSSRIDLTWIDGSSNESAFTVEQAVDGGTFEVIASLADNATAFSVTGLAPPSVYRFRVRARNADGVSPYSNTVSLQTAFIDLVAAAVSEPPAGIAAGKRFTGSSTARNAGTLTAPSSKTRFYASFDAVRGPGDLLLLGTIGVSSLAPGATKTSSVTITVPAGTPPGTYHLLACVDDIGGTAESDEGNNCRASAGRVVLGQPDLVTTAVGDPPATVRPGGRFTAGDTVTNQGTVPAAATKERYYLSFDTTRGSGDRLLVGVRSVPGLPIGGSSAGTRLVTVPSSTPTGDYWLLACADDTRVVIEDDETNNCRAASRRLRVAP
jgi:subtilase family serine protease